MWIHKEGKHYALHLPASDYSENMYILYLVTMSKAGYSSLFEWIRIVVDVNRNKFSWDALAMYIEVRYKYLY